MRLVELELGAARHAKHERLLEHRLGIERRQVRAHELLERDHRTGVALDVEEARNRSRQLQLGEARRPAGAVAHDRRDREREVREPRQRMPRAQRHRERREQRLDRVVKARRERACCDCRQIGPSLECARRSAPAT